MREALIVSAIGSAQRAEALGLPGDRIVLSCKVSAVQDLIAVYGELARRCDYPLHLGLTEAGMGSKGIVASTAAMAVLLQQGIGDTIRVSLTPEPNGDRTREVIVAQEILQTMGLRSFTPQVTACPGCGRTTSTYFQELAERIQAYLRDAMPAWRDRYPGVENMHVAVMGCVVNGPGESKLANVGISLPGTGETPVAPVYVDGQKTVTLKGERIAEEFQALVDDYVRATLRRRAARRRISFPTGRRSPSRPSRNAAFHMASALQAVRGMNDVLPDEAPLWERFEDTARAVFAQYGYRNIRVPIVEPTALFVRGIGEFTDVVEKEMYTFEDKLNGESLTLRPEATAGIVRATHPAQPDLRPPAARVDERPDVPPRAAAEGPLPPVLPGRRGSARLRGARRRRRADRDARATVEDARPVRHRTADQLDRRRRRAARASQGADRAFRASRRRCSTPTRAAGCTRIRCASSTARIRRCRR